MVESLLEHETVEAEEVQAILSESPYPRVVESAEPPAELPAAAAVPVESDPVTDKPKRLPPNISPEPA
jgi:hypothetical protein